MNVIERTAINNAKALLTVMVVNLILIDVTKIGGADFFECGAKIVEDKSIA